MSNVDVELKCLRCKKYKINQANAYHSYSGIDFNEYLPICKKCIKQIYDIYFARSKSPRDACLKTCRKLDVAFYNGIVDMAIKQNENTGTHIYQVFMQKLNSLGVKNGYGGKCFDEGEHVIPTDEKAKIQEEDYLQEAYYKWGRGYSPDDYDYLDTKLEDYLSMMDTDVLMASDITMLKLICQEELTIRHKRENGEILNKNLENLQKLMQTANIRPTDIKNANASAMADAYGKWVEDIEKNEPAEYFEKEDLFKDFDDVSGYFKKHVLRPLKNLLLGQKDFNIN